MIKKFLRQETRRHSKLGKNRKKLRKWRKPKGRDSKMRLNMKGHPKTVSVGYKSSKKESGKIENKVPVLVHNTKELEFVTKNQIPVLARIGTKKKLEVMKLAQEKKIKILNVGGKNETRKKT